MKSTFHDVMRDYFLDILDWINRFPVLTAAVNEKLAFLRVGAEHANVLMAFCGSIGFTYIQLHCFVPLSELLDRTIPVRPDYTVMESQEAMVGPCPPDKEFIKTTERISEFADLRCGPRDAELGAFALASAFAKTNHSIGDYHGEETKRT